MYNMYVDMYDDMIPNLSIYLYSIFRTCNLECNGPQFTTCVLINLSLSDVPVNLTALKLVDADLRYEILHLIFPKL